MQINLPGTNKSKLIRVVKMAEKERVGDIVEEVLFNLQN